MPKRRKLVGYMRKVLAANLAHLLASHAEFKLSANKPKLLSERADVSLSTVQRVLAGQVGASLDVIEQLAAVFDVSVYQLLLPNLDAENPQVVTGASAAERRWYATLRRAARADEKAPA